MSQLSNILITDNSMYYQNKLSVIKTSDKCVFSKADLWAIRLRDFLYDGFCLQSKTDKTLKNVNKHFRNFVGQNQQRKWQRKMGWKAHLSVCNHSLPEICVSQSDGGGPSSS